MTADPKNSNFKHFKNDEFDNLINDLKERKKHFSSFF